MKAETYLNAMLEAKAQMEAAEQIAEFIDNEMFIRRKRRQAQRLEAALRRKVTELEADKRRLNFLEHEKATPYIDCSTSKCRYSFAIDQKWHDSFRDAIDAVMDND